MKEKLEVLLTGTNHVLLFFPLFFMIKLLKPDWVAEPPQIKKCTYDQSF